MSKKKQRMKSGTLKNLLEYLISFNWIDGWYERLMRNERSIKVLAVLVVGIIYVSTQFIAPISWNYAEDVRGKALTAVYDTEKYIVEGLPKTVDFTLEGKEAIVKSIVKTNTFNAFVDLSQLKPGQHIVNIDYDVIPSQIKVSSNPKSVSVLIKEVDTVQQAIQLEYYNQQHKDPLIELGSPQLSETHVTIQGAKDKVEQIVTVKGMVDVSDPEKLNNLVVDLFAVDKQGNKVEVTLNPSQVTVNIPSSIPQKEVMLDLRFEDEFPEGKLLKTSEVMPSKINVYAPSKQLEALNVIVLTLKASDIQENGDYSVDIPKPDGVTKLEKDSVTVRIELEDEVTHTIKDVPIQIKGVAKGLKVEEDYQTSITLKGSKGAIEALKRSDFQLSVDVSKLNAGTHQCQVTLDKPLANSLKVEQIKDVQITLSY